MRLHSILPWPTAVFQPARKEKKTPKSRLAEHVLTLSESRVDRIPPPRRDFEDDEPPGDTIDITV